MGLILLLDLDILIMEYSTMLIKQSLRKNGLKLALPILLSSNLAVAADADWAEKMDIYVGAGIGQSYLTPPTRSGHSLDDTTGDAWKITAGVDLTDYISIEGFYADLGRATVDPSGDVSFRMQGADAIFHYWAKGVEREEGSVALYAKTGISWINTDQNFKRDHTTNIKVGLGGEMYLPHNFSVRLEAEKYYADADMFSVSLVKRFGFRTSEASKRSAEEAARKLAEDAAREKAAQEKALAEKLAREAAMADSDQDGVIDSIDKCAGTAKETKVDETGCAVYVGTVGESISSEELKFDATDIKFEVNSGTPTASSIDALDKAASVLSSYGAIKVEVQAHSDSSGSAAYNKKLSQKRAVSVVNYLVSKGVDASRLTAVGVGEARPAVDNSTAAGRAKNRRVEFVVLSK